ncbi:cobyrinate a,c-diamide synthase [Levilactobacillus yiduensis]|uniref:cobyrinate a,c-diamide synthase n=1 Tax=Levilactobacillus yiduensis TaxID=2953880 RepID=UPI000EF2DBE8|nr:cobyrinate a,c-diamide synthase [Levilactobacillus yiduensis]AYM02451.1 cobyrinate a,c-diamide synthase [Levilactobacillus brevis]
MKKILIAGVTSGAGKTSVALGLLSALSKRLTIQPYKVGPDYVDTKFHTRITGRSSRNLDNFLVPNAAALNYLFTKDTADVDLGLIEGVMGLYDGLGIDKDAFSTASVAKQLDVPVVLVVNARATSTSAAAIIQGFKVMDAAVKIVGVIVNNVMSENHYQLVKGAIERYTDVEVLGYLPHKKEVSLPSRQLGLVPDEELPGVDRKIAELGELIQQHVNLSRLLALAQETDSTTPLPYDLPEVSCRVGVARDEAFNFYYHDNLELMERCGMQLIPFSPIADHRLPEVDALYLGGGYPEEFACDLAQNQRMRQAIQAFSKRGRPIYAECGGLMYLGRDLQTESARYPMVGIFDGSSVMTPRLKRFGYCYATPKRDTLLAPAQTTVVGHEFHHSTFTPRSADLQPVLDLQKIRDQQVVDHWQGSYQYRRTYAGYLHVHLYQSQQFLNQFLTQLGATEHADC